MQPKNSPCVASGRVPRTAPASGSSVPSRLLHALRRVTPRWADIATHTSLGTGGSDPRCPWRRHPPPGTGNCSTNCHLKIHYSHLQNFKKAWNFCTNICTFIILVQKCLIEELCDVGLGSFPDMARDSVQMNADCYLKMKSFIAKQIISILVNLRYLRFKANG